jgi:hypothetical protein
MVSKSEWRAVTLQCFIFHHLLDPDCLVREQGGGGDGTDTVVADCSFEILYPSLRVKEGG